MGAVKDLALRLAEYIDRVEGAWHDELCGPGGAPWRECPQGSHDEPRALMAALEGPEAVALTPSQPRSR